MRLALLGGRNHDQDRVRIEQLHVDELFEPFRVILQALLEDLVKDVRRLHLWRIVHIEELIDEHKFLRDGIRDQLQLRAKDLFDEELLLPVLAVIGDDRVLYE